MNTNEHELLYKEEVYQITGCAMEVGIILNFKHAKLEWERLIL